MERITHPRCNTRRKRVKADFTCCGIPRRREVRQVLRLPAPESLNAVGYSQLRRHQQPEWPSASEASHPLSRLTPHRVRRRGGSGREAPPPWSNCGAHGLLTELGGNESGPGGERSPPARSHEFVRAGRVQSPRRFSVYMPLPFYGLTTGFVSPSNLVRKPLPKISTTTRLGTSGATNTCRPAPCSGSLHVPARRYLLA